MSAPDVKILTINSDSKTTNNTDANVKVGSKRKIKDATDTTATATAAVSSSVKKVKAPAPAKKKRVVTRVPKTKEEKAKEKQEGNAIRAARRVGEDVVKIGTYYDVTETKIRTLLYETKVSVKQNLPTALVLENGITLRWHRGWFMWPITRSDTIRFGPMDPAVREEYARREDYHNMHT